MRLEFLPLSERSFKLFEMSGSTPERLPIGRKSEYTNAKCIGSSIGNWAPLVSSL